MPTDELATCPGCHAAFAHLLLEVAPADPCVPALRNKPGTENEWMSDTTFKLKKEFIWPEQIYSWTLKPTLRASLTVCST